MANVKTEKPDKSDVKSKSGKQDQNQSPSESPPFKQLPDLPKETLVKLRRFAHLCDLIGDKSASRTSIIYLLTVQSLTPGELAEITGLSPSGVSQHLQKLASSGLINGERSAQKMIYTINPDLREEFESLTAEVL